MVRGPNLYKSDDVLDFSPFESRYGIKIMSKPQQQSFRTAVSLCTAVQLVPLLVSGPAVQPYVYELHCLTCFKLFITRFTLR